MIKIWKHFFYFKIRVSEQDFWQQGRWLIFTLAAREQEEKRAMKSYMFSAAQSINTSKKKIKLLIFHCLDLGACESSLSLYWEINFCIGQSSTWMILANIVFIAIKILQNFQSQAKQLKTCSAKQIGNLCMSQIFGMTCSIWRLGTLSPTTLPWSDLGCTIGMTVDYDLWIGQSFNRKSLKYRKNLPQN